MAYKAEDPGEKFTAEYVRANPQKSIRRVAKAVHHGGYNLSWDRVRDIRSAVRAEMGLEPPAAPNLKVVPSSGEKVALPAPVWAPDPGTVEQYDLEAEKPGKVPAYAHRFDPALSAASAERKKWLSEWLETHPNVLEVSVYAANRAVKAQFNGVGLNDRYVQATLEVAKQMAVPKKKGPPPRSREVLENAAKKQRVALEFIVLMLQEGKRLNATIVNEQVRGVFGQGLNSQWIQKAITKLKRAHERKAKKPAPPVTPPESRLKTDMAALGAIVKDMASRFPGLELSVTVKDGKVSLKGEVVTKSTFDMEV